jgi:hypothetical protein
MADLHLTPSRDTVVGAAVLTAHVAFLVATLWAMLG